MCVIVCACVVCVCVTAMLALPLPYSGLQGYMKGAGLERALAALLRCTECMLNKKLHAWSAAFWSASNMGPAKASRLFFRCS